MMFVKRASFNGIYKLEQEFEKLLLPYPVLRLNSENLRLTKRPLSKMRVSRSGNAVPLKEPTIFAKHLIYQQHVDIISSSGQRLIGCKVSRPLSDREFKFDLYPIPINTVSESRVTL